MIKKGSFTFIMGPCLIEDMGHALRHATCLRKISDELHVPIIYKTSYLKDNRTVGKSPRGPGIEEAYAILTELRGILPVITDVHSVDDVDWWFDEESETNVLPTEMIQIPAMLSRQTSLLEAAGKSSAKQVMIKKMTTMSPASAMEAYAKVGRPDTVICERGTYFGGGREVIDFEGVAWLLRQSTEKRQVPVIVDVTHPASSTDMALPLAKAACALGVDGIFAECHESPGLAPSDGHRMLRLDAVEHFIETTLRVRWA